MFNKVFWSILLIIIGLSLLANNFNVPVLKDLWKLWPLVFIYIGIKLIFPQYRRNIKIRADEAEELIKKLEEVSKKEKRYLRVNVVEKERDIVNITVPLSFLSWGLKFANTYAGKYGEKIEISPEEIENLIHDPDFKGRIVDINDPDDNVQVVIEII